MARLYRPYIPLETRCRVALRQCGYDPTSADIALAANVNRHGVLLGSLMTQLSFRLNCKPGEKLHLDHDPPLGARLQVGYGPGGKTYYHPDANEPYCLIYRTQEDHQIKTNVRGEHGQYPDRVLITRERRRKTKKKKLKRKWPKQKLTSAKRAWPKRSFPRRKP